MDLELNGLTALVTGASAGIGRGIAEMLAAEGARVALAGRNRTALDEVARVIAATDAPPPVVIAADLTAKDGPVRVADAALSGLGGRVDILVNNAGGSRPVPPDADDAFWEESLTLNFVAVRRLTERIIPSMKDHGYGRIIGITGAMTARTRNAAGPAKAAMLTWSRALSFELGPFGITVNTIAPGRINSVQILERLHPTQESRDAFIKANIPAGYFGEPADLAALAVFLASPRARYISGAAIPVDGAMARLA
jgi:3-oxoacyl-[acyl-carrier protein] reductase